MRYVVVSFCDGGWLVECRDCDKPKLVPDGELEDVLSDIEDEDCAFDDDDEEGDEDSDGDYDD